MPQRGPADLLLVNSLAPRQRSLSDTALENSLAIIRTRLEDRGFAVDVIDPLRLDLLEKGVSSLCIAYVRSMIKRQMAAYAQGQRFSALLCLLAAWPLQSFAVRKRKRYMQGLIDEIVRRVKEERIPFVGIKVWYGESFLWSRLLAARITEACPETVVIAGGPQVIVYREKVIEHGPFDCAVVGPGEEVMERLLLMRREILDKRSFLENLSRDNNGSRLLTKDGALMQKPRLEPPRAGITIPRYRDGDLQGKILFHTLVDGFGCTWNRCHFCVNARVYAHYRPRPVEQVIEEMKTMVRKGIAFFRFSSSDTPLPHGKRIARAILDSGLRVRYSMFTRCAKVTESRLEAYRAMIRSGLRAVFIGGETGHDRVNDEVMNKGVTRRDIVDTVAAIREAAESVGERCRVGLSLIYPCPVPDGVSMEEVFAANMALVRETDPDTVIVNPPAAFPGTAWFEDSRRFHFDIGDKFVHDLMRYEYALYKPPELWAKLDISLQGRTMEDLLAETGRLRREVASLGIPTEIADEYLMIADAIGVVTREGLRDFKRNSLIDIFSGSVTYMTSVIDEFNRRSRVLAGTQASAAHAAGPIGLKALSAETRVQEFPFVTSGIHASAAVPKEQ